ncbi:hypothetical protein BPMI_03874 [Candidatus Burkholderia pumila]|uniref:Uncharacterized protein n=1 Tax=Candidatus Burkholderia pumila TaxID=1090375 RepID=A0ABR5HNJ1_9BURK|nr:hypothetical protein BPMI_03874 [Candidatus Burkholderia pumila]
MTKPFPRSIMPTDEEDETINRGIALDPDTYEELSAEDIRKMRPFVRRIGKSLDCLEADISAQPGASPSAQTRAASPHLP